MDPDNRIRLVYLGLNAETAQWVDRPPFALIGVGDLSEYLVRPSVNPCNLFAAFLYQTHRTIPPLSRFLLPLWIILRLGTTSAWKRYRAQISYIVSRQILIVPNEEKDLLRFFHENRIDLLLVNAWSVLPKAIINAPRFGAINVHPSILPKHRGALPTLWSLKEGDTQSGVTLHTLSAEVDRGKVIAVFPFAIAPSDEALDLEQRVDGILANKLHTALASYVSDPSQGWEAEGAGSVTGRYQEYRAIRFADETIREIANKVTLYPHLEPFLYCYFNVGKGRRVYVRSLRLAQESLRPGQYYRKGASLFVGAKKGTALFRLGLDISPIQSMYFFRHPSGATEE